MDVGCGTGILSLFAAEAGAKKVYAIDASDMAFRAKQIVIDNGFQDIIEVHAYIQYMHTCIYTVHIYIQYIHTYNTSIHAVHAYIQHTYTSIQHTHTIHTCRCTTVSLRICLCLVNIHAYIQHTYTYIHIHTTHIHIHTTHTYNTHM